MAKIAVVYWSGTGNTEFMAKKVVEGATEAGAEATLIQAGDFGPDQVANYDAIAFGCPAMGDEILEESEFQPMWDDVIGSLSGKKTGLFGSYDWGDGEWMRNWEKECKDAKANLVYSGVLCHLTPDDAGQDECKKLGSDLAK